MGKTLYHSEAVKMGPVLVTVKSDVLTSKFKKDQRYVVLTIEGDDRNYNCENDDCAEFFDGQKGRSFTLVAEGSREAAVLTYVGEAPVEAAPSEPAKGMPRKSANKPPAKASAKAAAQTPPPASTPAPAQAQSTPPPTNGRPPAQSPETPEQRLTRARVHANKVANLWLVAYSAANFTRDQIRAQFNQEVSESQFQACVSTVMIQLSKDGFVNQIPGGVINVAPKTAAAQAPAPTVKAEPSDNDGQNV